MKGECFINNKDAFTTWGIRMSETAFTALLSPAPVKAYIQNKSAAIHGKQVLCNAQVSPKVDERSVQLSFSIQAKDLDSFLASFASFTKELQQGKLDIRTKYEPNVTYHFLYLSCNQFKQFNGRLGKFVLKLNEPNPMNRV